MHHENQTADYPYRPASGGLPAYRFYDVVADSANKYFYAVCYNTDEKVLEV